MMNIAFVLPEFVTEKEAGGLATYHDNIARLLADAGHRVLIFVQSDKSEELDYYPGIKVERVYTDLSEVNPNIPGSFMRAWSIGMKEALCKKINEGEKVDLVQYSNFMGYGIDRIDIPTVVRVSSYRPLLRAADREDFNIWEKYKSIKVPDFLEDIAVMKADAIYSPSYLIADYVKEQTGRTVDIMESPYYPHKNSGYTSVMEEKGLKGKKYILTFGSLKALKGAKLIGDSVYKILDCCSDLYWVFAGAELEWINGEGEKVIPSQYIFDKAKEYSDRLLFLGKLDQGSLLDVVKSAMFCVMPSRIDNLPNTCIEAMALKKVVIGTMGASFEQLIEDGKSGFLTERENADMLATTVCRVYKMTDKELSDIGMRAKVRIDEMSPDKILEGLINYYRSVIDRHPTSIREDDFYHCAVERYNEIVLQTGVDGAKQYLL